MQASLMHLSVLLPFQVFADEADVARIVAETTSGSFGLLPHRLDCVAALVPGILVYQCAGREEVYVAVDEGVLVKTGVEVLVSVRRALHGADLGQLRQAVIQDFLTRNAQEEDLRAVLARLEAGLMHRFAGFEHA